MCTSDAVADVEAARGIAKNHVGRPTARWRHTCAVAARACEVSHVLPSEERALLLQAAWLHDVGYAPPLRETGFHPLDGARYLDAAGVDRRVVCLVAHHSAASFEAVERGLGDELAVYEREVGRVMDALTYCDMTTGPMGGSVTLAERVAEILIRYPEVDPVHRAITRALPDLEASVRRVEERLAAAR